MTPDKALEIIENLKGQDGIDALKGELERQIQTRKEMIIAAQGEIKAFQVVIRTVSALEQRWGLVDSGAEPIITREDKEVVADVAQDNEMSREVRKRLTEGKCTFKNNSANGGKWCQRKLRTKAEKECGYCKTHMKEVGLVKDEEE